MLGRYIARRPVAIVLLLWLLGTGSYAQDPDLLVQVGDTTALPGQQDVLVAVNLSNFHDTVAGFNVWIQLDRPDIARFDIETDTVMDTTYWYCLQWDDGSCVDSLHLYGDTLYFVCLEWDEQQLLCLDSALVPPDSAYDFSHPVEYDFYQVDTVEVLAGGISIEGTLIEFWEYVDSRSLSGYGTDLNIAGIADLPDGQTTPGVGPQPGGTLVYLRMDVLDVPDTLVDRTVNLLVMGIPCFSDPDGQCIGRAVETVVHPDSSCYFCMAWAGDLCLNWVRVPWEHAGDCDSVDYYIDTTVVIDTTGVIVDHGSLYVLPRPEFGDINNDGSVMDIADLVYFVAYMFGGGPPPVTTESADCDLDNLITVSDLVCLVNLMFPSG